MKGGFDKCPLRYRGTKFVKEGVLLFSRRHDSERKEQSAGVAQRHTHAIRVVMELGTQSIRHAAAVPARRAMLRADDWRVVLRLRKPL